MTSIEDLSSQLIKIKSDIDKKIGYREALEKLQVTTEEDILNSRNLIESYAKVSALLNSIGESKQKLIQDKIEHLVTQGLQTIFSDSMSFHIEQETKGSTQVTDLIVRTTLPSGECFDTPAIGSRGGGVVSVISFLLRLIMVLLSDEMKKNPILILDEPFAALSKNLAPDMATFIREIVDRTGVQILMVTHEESFVDVADKAYKVKSINNRSVVKELQ